MRVSPPPGLMGEAEVSLLDSRAILFRASMALPAFWETHFCEKTNLTLKKKTHSHRCVTFHFCLARNLFIFSFDRLFVVVRSSESNAAIQG